MAMPKKMFAQAPLKKRALLDRRLVTEILLFFSNPTETRTIDYRTQGLLELGFGLFEQLLVEKIYASTLWRLLSVQNNPIKEKFTFINSLTEEEDEEYALAVEDATAMWAKHPKFQLVVSQYDRVKGSNIADINANVAYLDTTLRLARQLDTAIIPHPDRWTLYNWWFEQSIWATPSETVSKSLVHLPETSLDLSWKLPEAEIPRRTFPSSNSVLVSKQTIALARYGPMSYPFPKGMLRQKYSLEELATFPTFLYEFVISIPDENGHRNLPSSPVIPKKAIVEVNSAQQKQLQEAILSAFPTRQDLEMMVYYALNENLSAIAGDGKLEHTVFELIKWSRARGRLEELVVAALRHNSQNSQLISVAKQLRFYE